MPAKADAWCLERVYPEHHGHRRLELTGSNGTSIQITPQVDMLITIVVEVLRDFCGARAREAVIEFGRRADAILPGTVADHGEMA